MRIGTPLSVPAFYIVRADFISARTGFCVLCHPVDEIVVIHGGNAADGVNDGNLFVRRECGIASPCQGRWILRSKRRRGSSLLPSSPHGESTPCRTRAPFACSADIFSADGEICPLHKGGFGAARPIKNTPGELRACLGICYFTVCRTASDQGQTEPYPCLPLRFYKH